MKVKIAWRKPTKFECIQFTGENFEDIEKFCTKDVLFVSLVMIAPFQDDYIQPRIDIKTFNKGYLILNKGDYLLKREGDLYSIEEDLFRQVYVLENEEDK